MKFLCLLFCAQLCLGQSNVSVSGGYAQQGLQWSIAPSTLKWKNTAGPLLAANLQLNLPHQFYFESEYEHLYFTSGKVYDTDHDFTAIVYDEQFNAGKGRADKWLAGIGYSLPGKFAVTPAIGYSFLSQSLHAYNEHDLNSIYQTKWQGPYAKISASTGINKILFGAALSYSQLKYHAVADWNLIPAFNHPESFRHTANGYGITAQASALYKIAKKSFAGIKFNYFFLRTGSGIDELYLADGSKQQTQLNEVRSNGWQVMIEIRRCFGSRHKNNSGLSEN